MNVAGAAVRYAGIPVGALAGGVQGQPFVVTFSSTATPAIVQSVLRRIAILCTTGGARTITAEKHKGITLFLIPMKHPGLTIRPIWTIGDERTNEPACKCT